MEDEFVRPLAIAIKTLFFLGLVALTGYLARYFRKRGWGPIRPIIETHWVGKIPKRCDLCAKQLKFKFVAGWDGEARWVIMCRDCYRELGGNISGARTYDIKDLLRKADEDSAVKK